MKLTKNQEKQIKEILSKVGINEPRFNSWNEFVVRKAYKDIIKVLEEAKLNISKCHLVYRNQEIVPYCTIHKVHMLLMCPL